MVFQRKFREELNMVEGKALLVWCQRRTLATNMLWEGQECKLDAQLRRKGNCLGDYTSFPVRNNQKEQNDLHLSLLQKVVI